MSALNIPVEIASPSIEPSVALPIVEQITQSILDALKGITIASGYQTELIVERQWKGGNSPGDMVAVVTELDDELDEQGAPEMAAGYFQPYAVTILAFESEASTYPIRRRLQIAAADVHKVLMADYQRTRASDGRGLAVDTKPGRHSWLSNAGDVGAMDGVVIEFRVQYRTNIYDPYQLR